ncbi:MAG: hypothetical protein JOZ54_25220 [Acidobacteria bacterium]|nr:hypothetical protein [Acidobacteriota bacterium]
MKKPLRLLAMPAVIRNAAVFWAFYDLLVFLHLVMQPPFFSPVQGFWRIARYCVTDTVFNFLLTLIIFAFFDALAARGLPRIFELVSMGAFLIIASLTIIAFDALLQSLFVPWRQFGYAFAEVLVYEFHDTLLTVTFVTGLGNTLRSWAADAQARVDESRLEAAKARAEMATLTLRVQPAIVVQALRAIGAVVLHDAERARAHIRVLAEVLRESFRRDGEESVPRDRLQRVIQDIPR